ncbi:ABC transporter permease [Micromonospora sp. LZ34]
MTVGAIRRTTTKPGGRAAGPAGAHKHTPLWRRIVRDRLLWLFLLPGLAYFLIFHLGAAFGMGIAFTDYWPGQKVVESNWVGFDAFSRMFGDADFWNAVLNTVEISLLQLIFFFPVPLALALLLHSLASTTIKRLVQNVVYLPHFISWVIVVAVFQQILGGAGVINGLLADQGLSTIDVIGNPEAFKPLLVAQIIWKESGWGTIIFLAALTQVDETLYEASVVDGAGPWRRFWHVTLPGIRPVIVLLLVMRLGEILSVGFEQILLQRDAVGPQVGEIIDTFVYFKGIVGGDFPYAAAAGIFKGLVGAVLVYAANKVAHRLGEQGVYR